MDLPKVRDPFPINAPFKTEIDLYKVGRPLHGQEEDLVFIIDENYETIIAEKLDVIQAFPDHSVCYLTDDLDNLEACLWELAAKIAQEQPTYTYCDESGFGSNLLALGLRRDGDIDYRPNEAYFPELAERCFAHLQAQTGLKRLCNMLAVSIQEDMTLMRNTAGGQHSDQAECFIVAMPTHWDPAEKMGLNFSQIHDPVAENEGLKKSHPSLMSAMINKGPFVRYSWALSSSAALSQNPVLLEGHSLEMPNLANISEADTLLDALHFRVERQTFLNFPTLNRGLFTLHVYQQPLRNSLKDQARIDLMADSIESMSPAARDYRAMTGFADQLVAALRRL
ncbi:MAG: heme-dependent oxidative N-demethylase subunit alpha family protein [Chloroflexota bacterium]